MQLANIFPLARARKADNQHCNNGNYAIAGINVGTDEQLSRFRQSIDNIDAALIYMLAERFRITQAVGEFKAANALPAADPGREERQIQRLRTLAAQANLDPEFSEKFLRFVIDEVIRHHERIKNEG